MHPEHELWQLDSAMFSEMYRGIGSCSSAVSMYLEVELLESLDVIRPRAGRMGASDDPYHVATLLVRVDQRELEPCCGPPGRWLHLLHQVCELPQSGIRPSVYLHLQVMAHNGADQVRSEYGSSSHTRLFRYFTPRTVDILLLKYA